MEMERYHVFRRLAALRGRVLVGVAVLAALLLGGAVAVWAASETITVTADNSPHCVQDGGTATPCSSTYSVAAGHALTILAPTTSTTTTTTTTPSTSSGLAGYKFVGSIDTMKLSKDQASSGFTASDAQAVDVAASTAATHITVNTPLEYPSTMVAWANRIHADGKHVWFRLAANNGGSEAHGDASKSVNYQPPYDGGPGFGPGFLTNLHNLMLAHPNMIQDGDILDGDAEAENSGWWANNYGCGVQQGCTSCPDIAHITTANEPCSPVSEFNRFLQNMTTQENQDLTALGLTPCATLTSTNCVLTQVHSTDPGTATRQLSAQTLAQMGDMITVDAYPDQNTTDPTTAANDWVNALNQWHQAWLNQGVSVQVLVGEWGYSNAINVGDSTQESVVKAETTQAFPTVPFLLGTNYWVGPGRAGDGGYTQVMTNASGAWALRPAGNDVSAFYQAQNQ